MNQPSETAKRIVQILLPAMKRKYQNGRHVYLTEYGYKTIEGLYELVDNIILKRV